MNSNLFLSSYEDTEPCYHKGCERHITHPCEVCGRIGARGFAAVLNFNLGDDMLFAGFNCKECNKPFFVMVDSPDFLLENREDIVNYESQGFELVRIPSKIVGNINNWCSCNKK